MTRLCRCDQKTINVLARQGVIKRIEHGRFDLVESIGGYIEHLRARAAKHRGHDGEDAIAANARLKQSQRRLTELRIAQIEGKLIDREAIVEAWSALARADRSLFLSFPGRCRFDLPHLTGADQERMTRIAHEMLSELAVRGEVPPLAATS